MKAASAEPRTLLVQVTRALFDETGIVYVKLKGNCMFPIVRDSDIVTIEKFPYKDLRLGDVAVFQTTLETFHANTQFRTLTEAEKRNPPNYYLGKITVVERQGVRFKLDERSRLQRLVQMILSPANPYGLSLPKTVVVYFRKRYLRSN